MRRQKAASKPSKPRETLAQREARIAASERFERARRRYAGQCAIVRRARIARESGICPICKRRRANLRFGVTCGSERCVREWTLGHKADVFETEEEAHV